MDRMAAELFRQGWTTAEAINPTLRLVWILFVSVAPIPLLGGLVLAVLGLVAGITDAGIVGAVFVVVGAAGLLIGLRVRRRSRTAPGKIWSVNAVGVTVDGIGPVPWSDLGPAGPRLERAVHDSGWQRAVSMQLTPVGQQRALTLPMPARRVLNPAVRSTLLGGDQPLRSVRIPAMKGLSAHEFGDFLNWARMQVPPPR